MDDESEALLPLDEYPINFDRIEMKDIHLRVDQIKAVKIEERRVRNSRYMKALIATYKEVINHRLLDAITTMTIKRYYRYGIQVEETPLTDYVDGHLMNFDRNEFLQTPLNQLDECETESRSLYQIMIDKLPSTYDLHTTYDGKSHFVIHVIKKNWRLITRLTLMFANGLIFIGCDYMKTRPLSHFIQCSE